MLVRKFLSWIAVLFISFSISCSADHYSDPLSPSEALSSFRLNEDFNIELYAAEPLVKDPVAMTFDDHGNALVVEMHDYPFKPEPGKEMGRIIMLLDTDKDGKIDKSIVFADSLSEATSILPWKGGLIVTAAPDIFYLRDTNGDFRADTKELLFSGFFKGNSEAQITSLHFSVDNWIYANNNGQEGKVSSEKNPQNEKMMVSGADFRFRLDREQYEPESGSAQFGMTLDDYGHRFFTLNSSHILQAVLPWRYLHRHSYMPSFSNFVDISDHQELMNQETPAPYWRAERTNRRNQIFKEQHLERTEYADDHFTGAAGNIFYGGDAFPEKYYGNIFTGDVAGNLVHRDILFPSDSLPAFIAKRGDTERNNEFLTSSDPWFRPVGFTVGPDGCLYVIDMYRQHIETPFSIPEDLKTDMDFMNGSEYGRIYRIVPKQNKIPKRASPDLLKLESSELVKFLSHPNHPLRLQAHRILLERHDTSIVSQLRTMFGNEKDPGIRIHALYMLEGLNGLDANIVKQAIKDPQPGIREAGIMLAEHYRKCLPFIKESINDSSVQVAFQAALSLGNFPMQQSAGALAKILMKYGQQPLFRAAVLSSEPGASLYFFELLVHQGWFAGEDQQGQTAFLKEFSNILSLRNQKDEVAAFVKILSNTGMKNETKYQQASLKGLARGFSDAEVKPAANPVLLQALENMLLKSRDNEIKDSIKGMIKSIQ